MNAEENSKGADPPSGGSGRLQRKACAACRQQRNRCREDCQLAPHFPAECHDQFMNAHNLYGVGNMLSMLRRLDPNYHSDAMKTVKYESDARARDRAGGCYRIVLQLCTQYQSLINELNLVKKRLSFYQNQTNPSNHNDGNANDNNVIISSNLDQQQFQDQDQPDLMTSFCSDVDASADQPDLMTSFCSDVDASADQPDLMTSFCSDVDASADHDDELNYFLNEDDIANILVDDLLDDIVTTAAYNGNEPALLAHDQQSPNPTNPSDHNDGNVNDNNVIISSNLDQQQLPDQDQPDLMTSFCSDVDASADHDDALNYFLNEEYANILVDDLLDDIVITSAYNGNEPALFAHDQQSPNIVTD